MLLLAKGGKWVALGVFAVIAALFGDKLKRIFGLERKEEDGERTPKG
jgi:hypothetical protein